MFQDAAGDLDAGLAEFVYAVSLDFVEGVDASDDDAFNAFSDDEVGAGWCLAVMRTGFKADVEGGLFQERLVLGLYGGKCVHFGVALSALHVIAFSDNSSVCDDDGPDHGIWS